MFTGIIQSIGHIARMESRGGDVRLTVHLGDLKASAIGLGDSIAVNGVCLTAVEITPPLFAADVSRETLAKTTLGQLSLNSPVNLELALLPTTRLGGHLVSGHVDGVGRVLEQRDDGRSWCFTMESPPQLIRFIAEKGSICLNGISLTINRVKGHQFDVNIVPHTLSKTTLGSTRIGDPINIEVDLIARYLERLLNARGEAPTGSGVTMDLLQQSGFLGK